MCGRILTGEEAQLQHRWQSSPKGGSAEGHFTRQPPAATPTALLSTPTPASRQLPHISKSKTRGMKNLPCILIHTTLRAWSWNKQQFFMNRFKVTPLATMRISCCLRKFTGIVLPQLFQRITGSSSSAHSAVLSQAVEKGTTNLNNKPVWDTYPERYENFFLPHRHPNCLPVLNTCNQNRRECDLGL